MALAAMVQPAGILVLRDAMRSRMAPQDEVVEGETFYGRFGAAAKAA